MALLLTAGSRVVAQDAVITDVSVSEATVGTEFVITGTGFGDKAPKVFLVQNGAKIKGTALKASKPEGGTSVGVVVKQAVPGVFTIMLDPAGKSTDPVESTQTIEIVLPAITQLDDDTAAPKDEVGMLVEMAGPKPGVRVAGLKAKVLSVSAATEGNGDVSMVTFRVPNKVPAGTWDIEVTNAVGGSMLPGALTITGGKPQLGKVMLETIIPGQPSLKVNGKHLDAQGSFDGPTRLMATGKGKSPKEVELVLPFALGDEQAPMGFSNEPGLVRVVDAAGVEWTSTEGSFLIHVGAARDGLVSGSYSAELFPELEGADTLPVYGRFTYEGDFELPDGGGNTPSNLGKGEFAPGVNVQVLDITGSKGPTGNFKPGDTLSVTFRLVKDDGTTWHLDEMGSARAAVSGPTFNYQRVLEQVSDIRTSSIDNGNGTYTYKFPTPIPATYLPPVNDTDSFDSDDGELAGQPLLDGTYTVALWFYWNYTAGGSSERDVGVATVDFLIGSSVALVESREVVTTAHCNQCHTDLQAHGGGRKLVESCLLCHTAGSEDRNVASAAGGTPGVTVEFAVMIHKIHNGAHLPSVNGVSTVSSGMNTGARDYTAPVKPYQIVGFGNSVHDFSDVEFPAWPNFVAAMPKDLGYSSLGAFQSQENAILRGITSCDVCHGDPDGDEGPIEAPDQGVLAFAQPSRNVCGACHDDWIPTVAYVQNTNGMPAQTTDSACIQCHPQSGVALAVQDAHLHPLRNPAVAEGVVFDIQSVVADGAEGGALQVGDKLAVTFTIRNGLGLDLDPSLLVGRSVVVSGPSQNSNIVLSEQSIPAELLTGAQPYTIALPERVYYEHVTDATPAQDIVGTLRVPHLNATGQLTEVRQQTGFGAGASVLAIAARTPTNYVDVIDSTGFARDDYVLIDGGTADAEYLRIQWVDGNRLWFSSPQTQSYAPGPATDHAAMASVQVVVLADLVEGVNYSLDAASGTLTESLVSPFGDGNPIVVTYSTDFRLPATYPLALNAGPDLDEQDGSWAGKSLVSGTYAVTMWGSRSIAYVDAGIPSESNSYRDGAKGVTYDFLVGAATTLEPYDIISSVNNCNACHVDIQFHGSNRRGFESCFACHATAGAGDRTRYVAPGAPDTDGVTINFREMVHKIHRGAELDKADSYTVVGFGSPNSYPNNFSSHTYGHVEFPAMPAGVQDCARCHGVDNLTWTEPGNRQHPTEQVMPVQEWRVACGSCHDGDAEQAHIQSQTSPLNGAESCLICHGADQQWDVESLHQVR